MYLWQYDNFLKTRETDKGWIVKWRGRWRRECNNPSWILNICYLSESCSWATIEFKVLTIEIKKRRRVFKAKRAKQWVIWETYHNWLEIDKD